MLFSQGSWPPAWTKRFVSTTCLSSLTWLEDQFLGLGLQALLLLLDGNQ